MPPSLIRPARRNAPRGLLTPAGRNLNRGLVFYTDHQPGSIDVVGGDAGSILVGLNWPTATPYGDGYSTLINNGSRYWDHNPNWDTLDTEITVAIFWKPVSARESGGALTFKGYTGAPYTTYSIGAYGYVSISGTSRSTVGAVSATTGQWYLSVLRWRSGEVITFDNFQYPAGGAPPVQTQAESSSSAYSGTLSVDSSKGVYLHSGDYAGGKNWPSIILSNGVWNRRLSDADVSQLLADPFAPIRVETPYPIFAPVGGTAHTIDITDAVGITDLVTAPKSIAQTITDDVGITDSVTAPKSIVQTITDAMGVTDVMTRVWDIVRTVTDAVGITDVVTKVGGSEPKFFSFTPPTFGEAIGVENKEHQAGHSMWRLYGGPIPTPYVVIITDGVATPSPGVVSPSVHDIKGNAEVPNATASYTGADAGSGDAGLAVFTGGRTYTVTEAESIILVAAGYSTTEI